MNIEAEKAAIEDVVTAFAHTLNTGNKDALRDFFAKDGVFMPEGFKSIPSSRLAGPTDFPIWTNFQIAFTPEDIVIDGGYGFARFTALTNTRNPETGTPTRKKSRDFFVFRKEQDNWKIYRYMFNNVKEIYHSNADIMSKETNKQVMSRFVQFINTADPQLADQLISPKAIFYVPGRAEPIEGPQGYLAIVAMMRSGFPDIQWALDELILDDDKAAARFTMTGTHQGAFLGVPPTGRQIRAKAINIYHFLNGQIIEEYGQPDLLGLMQQIGALPPQ